MPSQYDAFVKALESIWKISAEGSANVVKAGSFAWRTLTHDAERWFYELDRIVDGVGE